MDAWATDTGNHIVVVEGDADLGHVIALALQHHGVPIVVYGSLAAAWEATRSVPAALVLDAGAATLPGWSALDALWRHRYLGAAPVIVLSWTCDVSGDVAPGHISRVCLAKPFDARALDVVVTALLCGCSSTGVVALGAASASASDTPGAGAPEPSRASAWPVIAAGGGFIAVIGFMIHPVYVLAGIILMVATLLRWALEPADSGASA